MRDSASASEAAHEIGAALDRAAELINQTGAESRQPRLADLRVELKAAESGRLDFAGDLFVALPGFVWVSDGAEVAGMSSADWI